MSIARLARCTFVLGSKAKSNFSRINPPCFSTTSSSSSVPVIDISARRDEKKISKEIYDACSSWGAFVVTGHNVPVAHQEAAVAAGHAFFKLPQEKKLELHVQHGGIAWRGYMPLGGEYTHGKVDRKEGLYVSHEHTEDHPRVKANTPLYGKNLFPDSVLPEMRPAVLRYIASVEQLGHRLMELICISLGLDRNYIRKNLTYDPIALVRLFRYPTLPAGEKEGWGIGEHTDYGLWTLLKQDTPGLQFKHPQYGWSEVPMVPNSFVCNVGDLLDRMTEGRFASRPHRARNTSGHDRITIPFFFDPAWDAQIAPFPLSHLPPPVPDPERQERWSKTSIVKLEGPYSAFLAKKVAKVFSDIIPEDAANNLTTTRAPSTRFAIKIPVRRPPAASN